MKMGIPGMARVSSQTLLVRAGVGGRAGRRSGVQPVKTFPTLAKTQVERIEFFRDRARDGRRMPPIHWQRMTLLPRMERKVLAVFFSRRRPSTLTVARVVSIAQAG